MIRRMQKQGLVDISQDKKIRLTSKGLQGGEDIARRHRLAEWMVVRLLGMELHRAHIEAHRLEHGMSPELEAKLMERLGYPKKSPFGRPIPGTGQPRTPDSNLSLDVASPGVTYIVDRVPEEDPELLRFLADSLVIPDHEVKILEAAPYRGVLMVATQGDPISIGYNVAHQILVRPLVGP
jgi:DtxR family Mn-dependent transcriptional regulator